MRGNPNEGAEKMALTRLKSKRLWHDMTQQEVADAAGVPRAIVQQWERHTHLPRADVAIKVARVLGLDMEDLFHDFEVQRIVRESPQSHEPPPRGRPRRKEKAIA
jgi:DNA-binding XRE family transcriptional regulator